MLYDDYANPREPVTAVCVRTRARLEWTQDERNCRRSWCMRPLFAEIEEIHLAITLLAVFGRFLDGFEKI